MIILTDDNRSLAISKVKKMIKQSDTREKLSTTRRYFDLLLSQKHNIKEDKILKIERLLKEKELILFPEQNLLEQPEKNYVKINGI